MIVNLFNSMVSIHIDIVVRKEAARANWLIKACDRLRISVILKSENFRNVNINNFFALHIEHRDIHHSVVLIGTSHDSSCVVLLNQFHFDIISRHFVFIDHPEIFHAVDLNLEIFLVFLADHY